MPRLEDCHVLVLAAGSGTRMGGPKALMSVGGRAWWRVQNERLDALGAHGLGATWVFSQTVHAAIGTDPARPEKMVLGAEGPMFASLLIGLRSLTASPPMAVFVLPVDTPVPGLGVWEALAAAGGVTVPECEGRRGHPACLAWDWVESAVLGAGGNGAAASTAQRLDELMAPVVRPVAVSDPAIAMNLNTPDDVQRYLASLPLTTPPPAPPHP